MLRSRVVTGLFALLPIAAFAGPTDPKAQVVALLKSFETGDNRPLAVINPKKYIQHNLDAKDGLAGLLAFRKAIPAGTMKGQTVRVFRDGNFVFTHGTSGGWVGFDVFRFEKGKIVEHWDNLQQDPGKPNPSGRTMIDGPTQVTDRNQTAANKRLVTNLVRDVLKDGKVEMLRTYLGDHYNQHNPYFPDGVETVVKAFTAMRAQAKPGQFGYTKIHRVLGEGNFVLAMSEGNMNGQPFAFYDMFRVEKGKVVEHWDVVAPIPPRSAWKNANGKF